MNAHPEIILADLENARHTAWITEMTAAYALDPLGNGAPLPEEVLGRLIPGLRQQPGTRIFLALRDELPVGIATCFGGFSTFAARPLINVHDLYVAPECRGQGLGKRLLAAVEEHARSTDCCKLTLEVLENNVRARRVYEGFGFAQAVYTEGAGGALFYAKPLTD